MEFSDQKIEDNGKWCMLKSTIHLHLGFSTIASYLIILFSVCLQEKSSLQNVCKKEAKHVVSLMTCFRLLMCLTWSTSHRTCYHSSCTGYCSQSLLWKKKILPLLIWSKGTDTPSLVASCKPGSRVKTGTAWLFQFPSAAAGQVVLVNGCGRPPWQVRRTWPFPSKSHLCCLGAVWASL